MPLPPYFILGCIPRTILDRACHLHSWMTARDYCVRYSTSRRRGQFELCLKSVIYHYKCFTCFDNECSNIQTSLEARRKVIMELERRHCSATLPRVTTLLSWAAAQLGGYAAMQLCRHLLIQGRNIRPSPDASFSFRDQSLPGETVPAHDAAKADSRPNPYQKFSFLRQ